MTVVLRLLPGGRAHVQETARCSYEGKGKGSPYSIAERRVPELIPVLGSHPMQVT